MSVKECVVLEGKFTPTEVRILTLLSDGYAHKRAELRECLDDDLASTKALPMVMSRLRKKLWPHAQDIICVLDGKGPIAYRHVRLIGSSEG